MTLPSSQLANTLHRRFLLVMMLVVVVLGFVYPLLLQPEYSDIRTLHKSVSLFASLLALVAGLALIVHFYTLGEQIIFLLGLAYILGGFMEIMSGLLAFGGQRGFVGLRQAGLQRAAFSMYLSGRLMMGLLLIAAPMVSSRMKSRGRPERQALWVSLAVLLFGAAVVALAFWIGPLSTFWQGWWVFGRMTDFLLALVFVGAFVSLALEFRRSQDLLLWLVLLSVGVIFVGQAIQSFSRRENDAFYIIGHAYVAIAFMVPLLGFPVCQITSALRLNHQSSLLGSLMHSTPDLITFKDAHFVYRAVNKAFCEFLGRPEWEIVGKTDFDLFDEEVARRYRTRDEDVLRLDRASVQDESLTKGEERKWFHVLRSPVHDGGGGVIAVLSSVRDITELKRMEQELRVLSYTDELTGLNNRRGFFALGEQLLRTAARRKWFAMLLYIDINGMKAINDALGHEGGDRALCDLAALLKKTYRQSDVLARLGGDEFAVLTMDGSEEIGRLLMARLQEAVVQHNEAEKRPFCLSISMGVTHYGVSEGERLDDLISRADKVMYDKKFQSREQVAGRG